MADSFGSIFIVFVLLFFFGLFIFHLQWFRWFLYWEMHLS